MLGRSQSWSGTSIGTCRLGTLVKSIAATEKTRGAQEELFTLVINAKLQSSQRFKIMEVKRVESVDWIVQSLVYNTKEDA
jgi:hypothetical protein